MHNEFRWNVHVESFRVLTLSLYCLKIHQHKFFYNLAAKSTFDDSMYWIEMNMPKREILRYLRRLRLNEMHEIYKQEPCIYQSEF